MAQKLPPFPKFPEQDENGVDLSLIRANLRLTPTERVRRADEFMLAWERFRARNPKSKQVFDALRKMGL